MNPTTPTPGTGIRLSELVNLKIFEVDFEQGIVSVRLGKGKKDRVVPIGDRALQWIEKYLNESRSALVSNPDDGFLFVSYNGTKFNSDSVARITTRYLKKAGINKSGSCHLFRHTMASLLLDSGQCDIRHIQLIHGHENLTSTELYTKVSIRKLKEIHTAAHPGANMVRPVKKIDIDEEMAREELFRVLNAEIGKI